MFFPHFIGDACWRQPHKLSKRLAQHAATMLFRAGLNEALDY